MKNKLLIGALLLLSATFSLATDNKSEYEEFLAEMLVSMGKVGSLVNSCALNKEPTLCDAADGLVSAMRAKMEALPEEEKANHATALALLQGFFEGYEAGSSDNQRKISN